MSDDLVAFVQQMDRCWLEQRFDDLARYIASDVVMVAPDGRTRIQGLGPAIDSYRAFMTRCRVDAFDDSDHIVTLRGDAAVVEYAWTMLWSDDTTRHDDRGREVLVLARRADTWHIVWRTQLPAR
jgi:hypothetical protein